MQSVTSIPSASRRDFLRIGGITLAGAALGGTGLLTACAPTTPGSTAAGTVTVGAIQDLSGGLEIYGEQQLQASQLAIAAINGAGGANDSELKLVSKNSQSQDALNVQYTRELLQNDKAAVIVGALTSSSREAMRPLFAQNKGLLFYPSLYEGGVCDKNVVVTGPSASQQIKPLVEYALKNLGQKFYIVAPDYNYGTISATWYEKYVTDGGGEIVGQEFLALDVSNYASTISKIQAAKPDVVVWLPVGAAQTGFAAQFAAAGLKDSITLISTNYGSGNQQVAITPEAGEGIIVCLEYVPEIDLPANDEFKAAWEKEYGTDDPIIDEAANTWTSWNLWAAAVDKAGSTDVEKVLEALHRGLTFESPGGPVSVDPATNHLIRPMYIARGNANHGFDIVETIDAVVPEYEQSVCDLVAQPDTHEQFVPEG